VGAGVSLLSELKSKAELEPSTSWEVVYLTAMSACSRVREVAQTQTLLDEAHARGCAGHKHYNALMFAARDDGPFAQQVFSNMRAAGLRPRSQDWRTMLSSQRDMQTQHQLYKEMRSELPKAPLEEIWAIMLRSGLQQDNGPSVQWVLEEMRTQGVDPKSEQAASTPSLDRALRWVSIKFPHALSPEKENASSQGSQLGSCAAPPGGSLPTGWSSNVDPSTGVTYYWKDIDPTGTCTWTRPV